MTNSFCCQVVMNERVKIARDTYDGPKEQRIVDESEFKPFASDFGLPFLHVPENTGRSGPSGHVVEICGDDGTGKTECMLHCVCQCIMPRRWKGRWLAGEEQSVIWIDNCCSFSILRLATLLESRLEAAPLGPDYNPAISQAEPASVIGPPISADAVVGVDGKSHSLVDGSAALAECSVSAGVIGAASSCDTARRTAQSPLANHTGGMRHFSHASHMASHSGANLDVPNPGEKDMSSELDDVLEQSSSDAWSDAGIDDTKKSRPTTLQQPGARTRHHQSATGAPKAFLYTAHAPMESALQSGATGTNTGLAAKRRKQSTSACPAVFAEDVSCGRKSVDAEAGMMLVRSKTSKRTRSAEPDSSSDDASSSDLGTCAPPGHSAVHARRSKRVRPAHHRRNSLQNPPVARRGEGDVNSVTVIPETSPEDDSGSDEKHSTPVPAACAARGSAPVALLPALARGHARGDQQGCPVVKSPGPTASSNNNSRVAVLPKTSAEGASNERCHSAINLVPGGSSPICTLRTQMRTVLSESSLDNDSDVATGSTSRSSMAQTQPQRRTVLSETSLHVGAHSTSKPTMSTICIAESSIGGGGGEDDGAAAALMIACPTAFPVLHDATIVPPSASSALTHNACCAQDGKSASSRHEPPGSGSDHPSETEEFFRIYRKRRTDDYYAWERGLKARLLGEEVVENASHPGLLLDQCHDTSGSTRLPRSSVLVDYMNDTERQECLKRRIKDDLRAKAVQPSRTELGVAAPCLPPARPAPDVEDLLAEIPFPEEIFDGSGGPASGRCAGEELTLEEREEFVTSCLARLYLFRCHSNLELISTIESSVNRLLVTVRHVRLLAIDRIASFYYHDRTSRDYSEINKTYRILSSLTRSIADRHPLLVLASKSLHVSNHFFSSGDRRRRKKRSKTTFNGDLVGEYMPWSWQNIVDHRLLFERLGPPVNMDHGRSFQAYKSHRGGTSSDTLTYFRARRLNGRVIKAPAYVFRASDAGIKYW